MLNRLFIALLVLITAAACTLNAPQESPIEQVQAATATATASITPTDDLPPTPQPTLTPSRTLRPPPTLEPPTNTPEPSNTPTITPSATLDLSVSIPGLRGAETATPTDEVGCVPREDWGLRYRVAFDDALARIAERYNISWQELAEGNCLENPNLIVEGQELRVPGQAHPEQPRYECIPFTVLTPFDGTLTVPDVGQLVFNWQGPRVPHTLIRIYPPGKHGILDGSQIEIPVERRQNETIDIARRIPQGGTYTWELYPLDENFVQIDCPQGGPWRFTKPESPPPTATPDLTLP